MGNYSKVRGAANYVLAALDVAREGNYGLARYYAGKANVIAAQMEARPLIKVTARLMSNLDSMMATELDAELLIEDPSLVIEPPLDRLRRVRAKSRHYAEFLRCREVMG